MYESLTHLNKEVEELRQNSRRQIKTRISKLNVYTRNTFISSRTAGEKIWNFWTRPESEASASEGKGAVGMIDFVCDFLHGFLGFGDPKRNMEFQRVHRIGKSVLGKSRPILTRFYTIKIARQCCALGLNWKILSIWFCKTPLRKS